jgi:hypothetical protein
LACETTFRQISVTHAQTRLDFLWADANSFIDYGRLDVVESRAGAVVEKEIVQEVSPADGEPSHARRARNVIQRKEHLTSARVESGFRIAPATFKACMSVSRELTSEVLSVGEPNRDNRRAKSRRGLSRLIPYRRHRAGPGRCQALRALVSD